MQYFYHKKKRITDITHRLYFFFKYFHHSQHCLSDVQTNSPGFGGGWRKTSGFEWPGCARQQQSLNRVWVIPVLGSRFNKKVPNPTILGRNDQWVRMQSNHCPSCASPTGKCCLMWQNLCFDFPLGHLGDLQGQWHLLRHLLQDMKDGKENLNKSK